MQETFPVEELIVDDSFISFCNCDQKADMKRWEDYLLRYPDQKAVVEEARAFVLGLKIMLQTIEKEKALESFRRKMAEKKAPAPEREAACLVETTAVRPLFKWWMAAASLLALAVLSIFLFRDKGPLAPPSHKQAAAGSQHSLLAGNFNSLQTGAGERKTLVLPDGSRLTMNARSSLQIDSSFGKTNRLVHLQGEAFFDVAHNAALPFVVRLKDFDVKVLGTRFNVRSYDADRTSETALVKGKVEITWKKVPSRPVFLKPNQKAIIPNSAEEPTLVASSGGRRPKLIVKPLSLSSDGNSVAETGWTQNRLEIADETFAELKNKLERWYDVTISFSDEEVMRYPFTATFENETIEQALRAMQLSYPFHYNRSDNIFVIGK